MSGQPEESNARLTHGSLLARNAYINFIGQILPILVAIFTIPLLIKVLGTERFGVLALAWVVMGYFGLFDFGMGRATTKFVAEHHARNETETFPELVWSSVIGNFVFGFLGGAILALLTPWLTESVLNIPAWLLSEAQISFYLLAVSVPVMSGTAALRGVLEAVQRFDLVNLIKIPASIINYAGPLVVLYFFRSLVAVIAVLVISRGLVFIANLFLCLRVLPILSRGLQFNVTLVKRLLSFSGWLTVFSFIGPSIATIDRFMIGAFLSLSAVTLYATPYEVVTKLMIFSASLLAVLFPAFSAMAVDSAQDIRGLYLRACKYLLAMLAPIVGVLLALSHELLSLWVAPEFAQGSAPVAQWLSLGVLIHSLGHVSFTVLQSVGRADIPAKLQLIQLPFYVFAVWYLIGIWGITGVAIAWTLRTIIDAALLFFVTDRILFTAAKRSEEHFFWSSSLIISGFLLLFWSTGLLTEALVVKVALVMVLFSTLLVWEWLFFLKPRDRKAFIVGGKPLLRLLQGVFRTAFHRR